MNGRNLEPRTVLWAVAEVAWEDLTGTPNRASATLEDTSPSGACIRLKTPITVGSRITVKWHREQFSGVARNCRSDGKDFLLGVRREMALSNIQPSVSAKRNISEPAIAPEVIEPARVTPKDPPPVVSAKVVRAPAQAGNQKEGTAASLPVVVPANSVPQSVAIPSSAVRAGSGVQQDRSSRRSSGQADAARRPQSQPEGSSRRQERKGMHSKGFFPKFWRRPQNGNGTANQAISTEVPVNKSHPHPAESLSGPQGDLLSYEDIYHAAGILSSHSGYGIHKVVEMINSDRIRELSKEVKRASVLMALDAAGTSANDLLQDATRRQQALSAYEAGQQRQLEEFESRIAQETAQIQAEMERVTAHYAERIQRNEEQIVREREALHNWQKMKEHESQRISEVIELCTKQPAAAPPSAMAASASATGAVVEPARKTPASSGPPTEVPARN